MRFKKIMLAFGTRPEAIKMIPVIRQLRLHSHKVRIIVVLTGQHREMLSQILGYFKVKADYNFDIMKGNQTLFDIVGSSLTKFKQVLSEEKPDIILVQGDTTTSFVASLAAFFMKIPVGHIEAGLRTYDKYNPFPEEINRHLISVLSDIHFVPTKRSYSNLISERVNKKNVFITGNTVIDMLHMTLKTKAYNGIDRIIPKGKKVILVTAHRRENFGIPFKNICLAIKKIAYNNQDVEVIYPVHPNPNVQNMVKTLLTGQKRIRLIKPLDYVPFVHLMNKAYLVLTDSGGVQEEAPALGKPVLVMRKITERPEAVDAGTVKLVGTDTRNIVSQVQKLLDNKSEYNKMSRAVNPYGDGQAAKRIANCLLGIPFKEFKTGL